MRDEFHVHTDRGSFLVTITDLFGDADIFGGAIAGAVMIIILYLVFGTPFVIWSSVMKSLQSTFGSDTPFWTFVGIQVAFTVFRIVVNIAKGKSSFLLELVLQSIVFIVLLVTFDCIGSYQEYLAMDPAFLREAGIEGLSFWEVSWRYIPSMFDSFGAWLGALYIGYTGGAIPAVVTCIISSVLG